MATNDSPRLVELKIPSGETIYVEVDPDVRLSVSRLGPAPPPGVAVAGPSPRDVVQRFEELAQYASDRATQIVDKFRAAGPGKISLEFAIGLEGEAGIPFLAKGTGSANITITAEWAPRRQRATP